MSTAHSDAVEPAAPRAFGRYRVLRRIGEGGMGVVHLAASPEGDLLAVKALRPYLVGGDEGRGRLAREVAVLQRVRGPRVAEVVDADVSAPVPYVVTRYVPGPSLDKVVADHGPLRGDALRRLAEGLALALDEVHAAGVVHRDVKPGNVLLLDGEPVLIDFGLARVLDEGRLTATGLVIGTAGYLAPETVLGQDPSPATDVHGWAATIAFAATGRPPFGRGPDAVVLERIRTGKADLEGIDPPLLALLRVALVTDPAHRLSVPGLLAGLGTGPRPAAGAAGGDDVTVPRQVVTPAARTGTAGPARVDPDRTGRLGRVAPPTLVDRPPVAEPLPAAAASPAARHPGPPAGQPYPASPPYAASPASPDGLAYPASPPYAAGPAPPTGQAYPAGQRYPARPPADVAPAGSPGPGSLPPGYPGPAGSPASPGPLPPPASGAGRLFLVGVAGLVVAGILAAPYAGLLALGALCVLARTGWRVRRQLTLRRWSSGPRSSDGLLAALGAPWHAVGAAVSTAVQALVVVPVAVLGGLVAAGGWGGPRVPLVATGLLAVLLAWVGPGAEGVRRGGQVVAARVSGWGRAGWVLGATVLAAGWVLGLAWESYGTSWWPAAGPPDPVGWLGLSWFGL